MIVECIARFVSRELLDRLGPLHDPTRVDYGVNIGAKYVVLGVAYQSGIAWVDVDVGDELLMGIPLGIFRIVDPRPSAYWHVYHDDIDQLSLQIPAFHADPTLASAIGDDVPDSVKLFKHWKQLLAEEAGRLAALAGEVGG